jgi:hypothetical protein
MAAKQIIDFSNRLNEAFERSGTKKKVVQKIGQDMLHIFVPLAPILGHRAMVALNEMTDFIANYVPTTQ